MGNMSQREKYLVIIVFVVLLLFLIYFFGIRSLQNKSYQYKDEIASLKQQKGYYDQLLNNNEETRSRIDVVNDSIIGVENSFIPELKSEVIENYILRVFEAHGCPYLQNIKIDNVVSPDIILPDGTVSSERLITKTFSVTYSTTDGFNIPSYNGLNSVDGEDGLPSGDIFDQIVDEQFFWHGSDSIVGYDEFIAAIKEIEAAAPNSIKINEITVEDQDGYLLLTAKIDFFSCTFGNRLSTPNSSAPYEVWSGNVNVATDHGMIGVPYYCDDPGSAWYGVYAVTAETSGAERPFATYYSSQLFYLLLEENTDLPSIFANDEEVQSGMTVNSDGEPVDESGEEA